MDKSALRCFILSWAVVGISEEDSCLSVASLCRDNESWEECIERYVLGYMSFWNMGHPDKGELMPCRDADIINKGRCRIEAFIEQYPPIEHLPRFYIVFLNQPQIGCDADGFSDVFCL